MDILQEQFFALVRAGLWGTEADPKLFGAGTDWEQLYRTARAQALLGIVFDGVQTLPADCRPGRVLHLKWCNTLLQIEEKNRLLNRELANVYALCREAGVEPVLLKGQGVAQNYRNPLHRQCGDIDLFTGQDDFEKVNELLMPESTRIEEECFKHIGMTWHGVLIENHRVLNNLNAPSADRRFQQEIARWHHTSEARKLRVGDCEVTVPPLTFDAVYILVHSVLHVLNEGIGLRQICDWACLLDKQPVDKAAVARELRRYGLTRAARVFGVVAVEYLGLDKDKLPVVYTESDLKMGAWLMQDVWAGGNFGQFSEQNSPRPKGYWSGKWHTLMRVVRRSRKLGRLAPSEARWFPVVVALHSVQMQWKLRTKKEA